MGMDFKLYEGRNIIGRDLDCQITIADKTVSGKHALILFRAGKYSISDQQSTQGTFVNDEDINLEPRYLKDGDMIRIGQTVLKFRTSI
jgi:pSer/pThr/pTyr-binding forkhead associated (FHA) protein